VLSIRTVEHHEGRQGLQSTSNVAGHASLSGVAACGLRRHAPVLLHVVCRWWFLVCYVAEPHAVALEAQQVRRTVLACGRMCSDFKSYYDCYDSSWLRHMPLPAVSAAAQQCFSQPRTVVCS
jgi:hypothetical protein